MSETTKRDARNAAFFMASSALFLGLLIVWVTTRPEESLYHYTFAFILAYQAFMTMRYLLDAMHGIITDSRQLAASEKTKAS